MLARIKVPKLNENTDEVTITAWFRKEGDGVRKGDALVEMTTDKAAFELEAPRSGVVRSILAREKSIVPTGYVVALVGDVSDALPDVSAANARLMEKRPPAQPARDPVAAAAAAVSRQSSTSPASFRATPAARRLAREKGLDLAEVRRKTGAEVVTEDTVRDFLK